MHSMSSTSPNASVSVLVIIRPVVLQELGWYNPLSKETNLNAPSIKKWLTLGAKPSDTVETLLKKAMVIGQDD